MRNIVLYGHGGSKNHGCEALVRSTVDLIGVNHNITLYSEHPEEDYAYGVDKVVTRINSAKLNPKSIQFYYAAISNKIFRRDITERVKYKKIKQENPNNTLFLSIGGDNYCYGGTAKSIIDINRIIDTAGGFRVLWGCSIEPQLLNDKKIMQDIRGYEYIFARESLTYDSLINHGLNNVVLMTDTAFYLKTKRTRELPKQRKYIGINISPMVLEKSNDSECLFNCYRRLMYYLLEQTDYTIVLIPHVYSDIDVINRISEDIKFYSDRLEIINDCSCEALKDIISQCCIFVGARTHSTIAAYSSGIPTIVVGYSVKSKGIAKDIFGHYNNPYLIDGLHIKNENALIDAFVEINANLHNEKAYLDGRLKEYITPKDMYLEFIEKCFDSLPGTSI